MKRHPAEMKRINGITVFHPRLPHVEGCRTALCPAVSVGVWAVGGFFFAV